MLKKIPDTFRNILLQSSMGFRILNFGTVYILPPSHIYEMGCSAYLEDEAKLS